PRTDSRYLTADIEPRIPRIPHDLAALQPKAIAALDLEHLAFSKRITDNEKVKDHHAIIPTGVPPHALDKRAQQVYDAILVQLIAAFYPDCEKEVTTVDGESNGVPFQAKGTVILQPGWTALFPAPRKKEEDDQELPAFTAGEQGPHEPAVREGKTKPPKHYTENSLLAAMESAGKFVEDETLREALKESGIGTPATRAAIIETLLRRNYIRREKKTILATDMGRFLISLLQDNLLKSPEMTGEWEEKLHRIERGTYAPEAFMRAIADYTAQLVRGAVAARVNPARWGRCPLCGAELIAGKKGIGCSHWKEGCTYVLWRTYKELALNDHQLRELLQLHVLLRPVNLPNIGPRALRLTRTGALMDVECPRREQQNTPTKKSAPRQHAKPDANRTAQKTAVTPA
ncbi:MAG: DNA topoisomerase, partial [Kiritimatiellae bacterium]|nr:DNA topoisomerase [Kiritimatiellia bacterium]